MTIAVFLLGLIPSGLGGQDSPLAETLEQLQGVLDAQFVAENKVSLEGIFSDDQEKFVDSVDTICRMNQDLAPADVVECALTAFSRASGKGWLRGVQTAEMFLGGVWGPRLRKRISTCIKPFMRDPIEEVAWRSMRIYASAAGKQAAPELLKLLEDTRRQVRYVALDSLGRAGDATVRSRVAEFLKDEDGHMRELAIRSLVALGASDQADAIAELIHDKAYPTRRMAMEAMGQLKSDKHAALLVPILSEPGRSGDNDRSWAYGALLRLKPDVVVDDVAKLLGHEESDVRLSALGLLGNWRHSKHSGAVARCLNDSSEPVRRVAAWALGMMECRQESGRLLEMEGKKLLPSDVVIEALLRMGDRDADVAILLVKMAKALPEITGATCGNDPRVVSQHRFRELLRIAVEKKSESSLLALARVSVEVQPQSATAIVEALLESRTEKAAEVMISLPIPLRMREDAIRVLALAPGPRTVKAIMKLVAERGDREERFLWSSYAQSLSTVPDELVPYLKDENVEVRMLAGRLLCEARQPKYVPQIIKLLQDPDMPVRFNTAQGLRDMPGTGHHAALVALLKDRDETVRWGILEILRDLDLRDHADEVASLLGDKSAKIRLAAVQTLVAFDARSHGAEIAPLLNDPEAGAAAAHALGRLRVEAAAGVLAGLAREGPLPLRAGSIRALAQIGRKDLLPELKELLNSHEPSIRAAAVFAVGELKDATLEASIVERLGDPANEVKAEAARSLVALGARGRAEKVASLLKSRDYVVFMAAAEALIAFEDRSQAPRIAQAMEETGDSFKASACARVLLRLDAKSYMNEILSTAWPSHILYELNRVRAPGLYERIGKIRLEDGHLMETQSYDELAARLEVALKLKMRFDSSVSEGIRKRATSSGMFLKDTHTWVSLHAIPNECAPILDDAAGEIVIVTVEEARKRWLEWAHNK